MVVCEGGVLGLVHFARAEGAQHARECYLVPLTIWAQNWPELVEYIDPLIDERLRHAAIVKPIRTLAVGFGGDVAIAEYRDDLYLERELDTRARTAVEQQGGIIIVGKPKSGKTRLAYQVLRASPDALVVIPRTDQPPETFEGSSLAGKNVIIFFDDLHVQAETSRPLMWLARLEAVCGQPPLFICTTRDGEDWKRIIDKQGQLVERVGPSARIFTSHVEGQGEDLSHERGWEIARGLGLTPEEFFLRFDGTIGSILLDLAAMRRRYERLRDEVRGNVAMSRLLDSAKLLYKAHQHYIHESLLQAVAEQIRGEGKISVETWDALRRRTREEGFGDFDSTGNFLTYLPYLEQCINYEPSTREVERLLPLLEDAHDYSGLLYLSLALDERSSQLAEQACRLSIAGGYIEAYNVLGILLTDDRERWPEAEQTFRQAIDKGAIDAYFNLGMLLTKQEGREQEAEQAFRQAIDLGFIPALDNLGTLLAEQEGREQEAEQAFRRAINAGYMPAMNSLGIMLATQPGRRAEAEQAFRQAITAGVATAYNNLGRLLAEEGGDPVEAEQVFKQAIAAGVKTAYANLGSLLVEQDGRKEEAEQAFRQAIASGYPGAKFDLGVLLSEQSGREAEAEAIFREVIDLGNPAAYLLLGALLVQLGERETEAESVFHSAIDAGIEVAYNNLGTLLSQQPGREAEAEQAFRNAVESGSPHAYINLGRLLAKQPGREPEAEKVFRDAIEGGNLEAYRQLGYLLEKHRGREE